MTTPITTPRQLRELAKQLRAGGHGDIVKPFRKAVRDAGKPVLEDVRGTVLRLHIVGQGGVSTNVRGGGTAARRAHAVSKKARANAGLRATVASSVRVRNLARGVTIEVNKAKLPPDQRSMPNDLESTKGWRHPVFGNREVWAAERGGPWFYPTVRRHAERFRSAIYAAGDVAAAELAERVRSA